MNGTATCDECGSTFTTSPMESLCAECSHVLYGYPACPHEFGGETACHLCGWNGARSAFVGGLGPKRGGARARSTKLELLSAHVPGGGGDKLPLSALSELETHVHGELAWTVGERRVPSMGFFGPDDVCLGDWWDGLSNAIAALSKGEAYTMDSYEQGEPAFRFEREGPVVHFSIVAGGGGGGANPQWQREPIAWDAFVSAIEGFKRAVVHALEPIGRSALPADWLRRLEGSETHPL